MVVIEIPHPFPLVSIPYRGATFLNGIQAIVTSALFALWFPSPIGELHFSMGPLHYYEEWMPDCFHPLSGSYISQCNWAFFFQCFFYVSIPYRGATFLNQYSPLLPPVGVWFPSPIGELHFSIPSPQTRLQSGVNTGIAWQK